MPKFIVTHVTNKAPPFTPEAVKQMRPVLEPLLKDKYPEVVWNYAFHDVATGRTICDWDAPNATAVEDTLKEAGMPYDAVFPVTKLTLHEMTQT